MKALFLIAVGTLLSLSARAELATGVGVVVNDAVITYAEIEQRVEHGAETAARIYANDPVAYQREIQKIRDDEIERMVENKMILHEFTSAGYATNVLEAFIDDAINDRIQKEYYGDRARLIKTLQAQGITYEMYRRQEREQIIVHFMNDQNNSSIRKILISPLKVERYYAEHKEEFKVDDQVHLYIITIPAPSETPGSAHKIAAEILSQIDSGVPFEEMAGVYSSGAQRASGGDRGWVDRSDLRTELADAAFALKAGQHSGVIDLHDACFLLMVKEVRPAHIRDLSEVRGEIERTLITKESTHLHDQWIERLKRKSFVQYY